MITELVLCKLYYFCMNAMEINNIQYSLILAICVCNGTTNLFKIQVALCVSLKYMCFTENLGAGTGTMQYDLKW